MKRSVFFAVVVFAAIGVASLNDAYARGRVDINLGPPVIVVDEPPEVIYEPDAGVYYVPDAQYDIFFYDNFWWSRRGNNWYRSNSYRGNWGAVNSREVPANVNRVPSDYRQRYNGGQHMSYKDFQGHRGHPANQDQRSGQGNNQPQDRGNNGRSQQENKGNNRGQDRGNWQGNQQGR